MCSPSPYPNFSSLSTPGQLTFHAWRQNKSLLRTSQNWWVQLIIWNFSLKQPATEKPDGRELLRHSVHWGAGQAHPHGDRADGGAEPGAVQGLLLHQQGLHQVRRSGEPEREHIFKRICNCCDIPLEQELAFCCNKPVTPINPIQNPKGYLFSLIFQTVYFICFLFCQWIYIYVARDVVK